MPTDIPKAADEPKAVAASKADDVAVEGEAPHAGDVPRGRAPERKPKTFATPVVFQAKTLVRDGNRQRERKSRVVLADGKVRVEENESHARLHEVPYDDVVSISYSRGRDPLWNTPTGPRPVTRAAGGRFSALGIFTERDWVSLRTTNARAPFVVLSFDDQPQAKRAMTALEERTGRSAEHVGERRR